MTGEWIVGPLAEPPPRATRVELDLDDGTRVTLADTRALGTFQHFPAGSIPLPELGLEPLHAEFTTAAFHKALERRRAPIKQVLLDQRVVAGVGNIYAAEALWLARIDPRRPAQSLTRAEAGRLVRSIRRVLELAPAARYSDWTGDDAYRWRVYDREGQPCRRCGRPLKRIVQAGRSTYFCASCVSRKRPVAPLHRARSVVRHKGVTQGGDRLGRTMERRPRMG
jgi:formamidopyrimidine-DNA glycosylase